MDETKISIWDWPEWSEPLTFTIVNTADDTNLYVKTGKPDVFQSRLRFTCPSTGRSVEFFFQGEAVDDEKLARLLGQVKLLIWSGLTWTN